MEMYPMSCIVIGRGERKCGIFTRGDEVVEERNGLYSGKVLSIGIVCRGWLLF